MIIIPLAQILKLRCPMNNFTSFDRSALKSVDSVYPPPNVLSFYGNWILEIIVVPYFSSDRHQDRSEDSSAYSIPRLFVPILPATWTRSGESGASSQTISKPTSPSRNVQCDLPQTFGNSWISHPEVASRRRVVARHVGYNWTLIPC